MVKRLTITKQDVLDYARSDRNSEMVVLCGVRGRHHPDEIRSVHVNELPDKLSVQIANTGIIANSAKIALYEIVNEKRRSNYSYLFLPKSVLVEEEVPDFVDTAKAVLEKEMPGRYYTRRRKDGRGEVYLHYPVIVITNTIGDIHTIHDLVIRLTTFSNGIEVESIGAKRYAYDTNELRLKYNHSHLETSLFRWQAFCYGSTPFSEFIKFNFKPNPTPSNFSLFLAQMESYLAWESMEGKPYKSISDLGQSEQVVSGTDFLASTNHLRLIVSYMLRKLTPDMLGLNGSTLQLMPHLCDEKLLALEVEACHVVFGGSTQRVCRFNPAKGFYVESNSESGRTVYPSLDSSEAEVVAHLGITPRIIQISAPEEPTHLVWRLSKPDAEAMVELINIHLTKGYKVNDRQDNINKGSEGSDHQRVTVANHSFA